MTVDQKGEKRNKPIMDELKRQISVSRSVDKHSPGNNHHHGTHNEEEQKQLDSHEMFSEQFSRYMNITMPYRLTRQLFEHFGEHHQIGGVPRYLKKMCCYS